MLLSYVIHTHASYACCHPMWYWFLCDTDCMLLSYMIVILIDTHHMHAIILYDTDSYACYRWLINTNDMMLMTLKKNGVWVSPRGLRVEGWGMRVGAKHHACHVMLPSIMPVILPQIQCYVMLPSIKAVMLPQRPLCVNKRVVAMHQIPLCLNKRVEDDESLCWRWWPMTRPWCVCWCAYMFVINHLMTRPWYVSSVCLCWCSCIFVI